MVKRAFDFVASAAGLLIFSPLLIAIAVWIKWDSPGPVFYRGRRLGRYGQPFGIFKFRSMVTNADKIGGPSTSGDDPRVTRSGHFIRRFKLDELTQLINVLVGQMSLVGPRPEVIDKLAAYVGELEPILAVRPGITDWASIWNADEGGLLAGTEDPDAVYEQVIRPTKLKLQLFHCQTRTFTGDIKIILFTLAKIFRKDFIPQELQGYPTFHQMRQQVEQLIAEQSRRSSDQRLAA